MIDDDPFAEPGDTDKTVIKPNPMGRRSAPAKQPATDQQIPTDPAPRPISPNQPATDDAVINLARTGMNRLNATAATLFALVSRIRNRAQHMDPDELRRNVVSEVRSFENRALKAGIDNQNVKIARYAICATIDDVVLNTPWGGNSNWTQQTMVGTFHKETVGGDRFFDLLARLEKDGSTDIDLLEFLYICLSLGFEGRLRVDPRGADKHMQIRAGLARLIRDRRGAIERDLSPHWKGVDKKNQQFSVWKPVWIAVASLAGVLGIGFFGLSWALGGNTDHVLGQLSVLDSGVVAVLERKAPPPPPPPPPPPEKNPYEKVKKFLDVEIREGIVRVIDDANTVTVLITGKGMFGSGSDQLKPKFLEPLQRIATALNDEVGPIIVAGHSDNIPIKTARFPSNTHLSLARAQSVMRTMVLTLNDPGRLSAEGRADKQPLVSNKTREGRAENRRIEVILVKQLGFSQ